MRTRRALLAAGALAPVLTITRWPIGQTDPHDAVAMDLGVRYSAAGGEDLRLDIYRPPHRDPPRPGGEAAAARRGRVLVPPRAHASFVASGASARNRAIAAVSCWNMRDSAIRPSRIR